MEILSLVILCNIMYLVIKLRKRNVYENDVRIDGEKKREEIENFYADCGGFTIDSQYISMDTLEKETSPLYTLGEVKICIKS